MRSRAQFLGHSIHTPLIVFPLGLLATAVSGWLGGELVQRLGVGVHEQAGLDAPSSLTRTGGISP